MVVSICLATVSFLLLNRTVSHVWLISLPALLTIAFALTSAITDSLWRKIPNWLTYPACLTGLVASSAVTWGGASDFWGELGLWESVQGMLTCFACMIFAYRASGGGAGDVKLATAYRRVVRVAARVIDHYLGLHDCRIDAVVHAIGIRASLDVASSPRPLDRFVAVAAMGSIPIGITAKAPCSARTARWCFRNWISSGTQWV